VSTPEGKHKEQAMKSASLLAALLAVAMLAGCKAKTSQTQSTDATDAVKAQLASMAATTDQLAKDNAELRKTLAALAQKSQPKNDLSSQLDQAAKTATDLQNANARLNSSLTESETKLQQAVAAFKLADEKAQAARIDALEAQEKALVKQNAELAGKLAALHDDSNMAQARALAKLQQQADDAQDALQSLRDQNNDIVAWLQEQGQQQQSDGTGIFVTGPAVPWWLWINRHGGGHWPVHPVAHGKENGENHEPIHQNNSDALPVSGGVQTGHSHGSSAVGNSGGRFGGPTLGSGHTQGSGGSPWLGSGGPSGQNSNTGGGSAGSPRGFGKP
jgi:hypothetical protein